MTRRIIFPLLVLLSSFCSSGDQPANEDALSVIVVFDMAGIGDKGFNDMGWAGVQKAVSELGVKASYLQSSEQADYVANLSLAAQQADVVVAMGFLMIESLKKVAPLYPETKFIFVDGEVKGDNIASFDFKSEEGAFLAGILAAMVTKTNRIGCVMGMDIPPVRRYETGFRAGILTVNAKEGKEVTYHSATIGDFNDPARGKALAQGLIGQGCDVVLQLAGNSGLGVIEAVKETPEGVYAIGADMDQDDLAPGKVLTSILKRIDVAVFEGIQGMTVGQFSNGHNLIGISDGGSSLTDMKHTSRVVDSRSSALLAAAQRWVKSGGRVPSEVGEVEAADFEIFVRD